MSFDFYMDAEEEWCYDTNPICDFTDRYTARRLPHVRSW